MNTSPYDWLPRPGESREIPGGVLRCKCWEVREWPGNQFVTGEIVFTFTARRDAYRGPSAPCCAEESTLPAADRPTLEDTP